jgi:hypothetical protein
MNWQDGLALLIVAIATVALLRRVLPAGMVRFGARQSDDGSVRTTPPTGGCGGCAAGSSCFKVQVKVYPVLDGGRPLGVTGSEPTRRPCRIALKSAGFAPPVKP